MKPLLNDQVALKLAAHGAKIAIIGTNQERGEQVVAEINGLNGPDRAYFYKLDVSKTAEVDAGVKQILERFGTVDILVNNAGITRDQLLLKMTEEDWDSVLDVNVKSCYNFCRALARSMLKARKGKIINISSVVGLTGNAGQLNYATAKAGMIGFTKALAKEFASRNIAVNCIAPGFIETGMTDVLKEEQKTALINSIPMGRLGVPEEIANAALFLASHLSDYITGQVITVDGGMVM
jgi:3-oxoacyl-[acyl-carrier protein] reductase